MKALLINDNELLAELKEKYTHESKSLNDFLENEKASNDYVNLAVSRRIKFLEKELTAIKKLKN